MQLCVFNPEHDLCLAKGRWNYVPPRSAVDFARRDAGIMRVLYPYAHCCSVYDMPQQNCDTQWDNVVAWGWDAVVRHELLKRGLPESLLPSEEEINTIRELQHRSTLLTLQGDCHEVHSVEEMEKLLCEREHWVMKAPWSGAGRGLRWVHGALTAIDRDWLLKTVATQRCVIAEPNRMWVGDRSEASPHPVVDVALEYLDGSFMGYSYFKTGSGVYKENIAWPDEKIVAAFTLLPVRKHVEQWLETNVWHRYRGPLGVDLMVCADGSIHVAEINYRHTMGMIAHERLRVMS